MGVDVVTMSYQSKDYIEFLKGDTVQIGTQIFTCSAPAAFERDRKWSYELEFLSKAYKGNDAQMLGLDEDNNLTEYECYLTGDANAVVDLIILNANRTGAGWVKGLVDATETLDFDFTGDTCNTALAKAADTFKTEFWWDNDTIHLTKKGADSGLSFRHGKGKGLTKLTRKNTGSKVVTRLHIYGSKQNLPTTYPGLSKRLRMPGGQKFIQDPVKVEKYGLIEDTKVFEDIFPRRVGAITSVTNELTFSDSSIDFDLNTHLVDGVSAKVKFLTGQLAGYILEIKERGYNHATKTITVLVNKNEQAMVVPSANGLHPAVGDQYIFLDVIMPQVDIANAEAELLAKGQEAYEATSDPIVQYEAETDRRYLRFYDINIKLGDFVNIADPEAGIDKDIRVVSKRTNLQDPYDVTIELSETTAVANIVKELINDKAIQKAIGSAKLTDVARQRLNWRTTAELTTMLDTLRAEMLLIMGEGGAYNTTIIYATSGNTFQSSAGTVTHDEYIENGGIWNVPALTVSLPANSPYYFYIRANKSSQAATMVYSLSKIGVNDEAGFYHFPFGILSSQFNGQRLFASTKGFTRVTGGNIQTGKITSSDGQTWFDLDNGEFRGRFTFTSGEDVRETLEGYADTVMNDAYEESIEYINTIRDNLQNQLDGVIESYFDDYEPTLANYPASTWDTVQKKDEHLGDTFTNDTTGKSYRWTLDAGNYFWKEIADTDALLALQKAQKAQDTADGKRRTFLNQPVGPYDRGDMWMTGADILVATTDRPSGSYIAGDWIKLDKYTDDSAVNNLQIGARNLLFNSKNINDPNFWVSDNNSIIEGFQGGVYITPTVIGGHARYEMGSKVPVLFIGEEYTLSVDVFCLNDQSSIRLSLAGVIFENIEAVINKWVRVSHKFIFQGFDNSSFYIYGAYPDEGFGVRNIKVSSGNKSTDWTPAPEDVEADATTKANAAKQDAIDAAKAYADTQIDQRDILTRAYADGIVTEAEQLAIAEAAAALAAAKLDATEKAGAVDAKIGILPTGKTIIENGKIATDLIVTDALIARQVQTSGANNITINQNEDNLMKWRHPNGVVAVEFGIINGEVRMIWYNANGVKTWEGGTAGIVYVNNVPESWTQASYKYLGNWSYPLSGTDSNAIKSDIGFIARRSSSDPYNVTVDTPHQTLYRYSAGQNGLSAANKRYEGLHTEKIAAIDNFAMGWYLVSGSSSFQPQGSPLGSSYRVFVVHLDNRVETGFQENEVILTGVTLTRYI